MEKPGNLKRPIIWLICIIYHHAAFKYWAAASLSYSERFHPEWLLLDKDSSDEESVLCQTKVNMVTISPSCPSKHFEHIFWDPKCINYNTHLLGQCWFPERRYSVFLDKDFWWMVWMVHELASLWNMNCHPSGAIRSGLLPKLRRMWSLMHHRSFTSNPIPHSGIGQAGQASTIVDYMMLSHVYDVKSC